MSSDPFSVLDQLIAKEFRSLRPEQTADDKVSNNQTTVTNNLIDHEKSPIQPTYPTTNPTVSSNSTNQFAPYISMNPTAPFSSANQPPSFSSANQPPPPISTNPIAPPISTNPIPPPISTTPIAPPKPITQKPKGNICSRCTKPVFVAEEVKAAGQSFHKLCYRCANCNKSINGASYSEHDGNLYDNNCYRRLFGPKGVGFGLGAGALPTDN